MKNVIVIILLPFLMDGVFGADEMKEVTDGDSLTLPTGLTQTQSSDRILWLYGSDKIIIAKIDKGIYSTNVDDERFKGNLELDKQTGSLTIKNIRIKNTGPYELEINRGTTSRRFSVKVYASLPTPDINSPQCVQTPAGPKCVFQCSVQTSEQTTLSWYSGNRVVSSKISDICSSISLRLEVNYEDKNIYSCMVNNLISNKTKHLDITQLCKPCEAPGLSSGAVAGIVVVLLVFAAAAAAGVIYYRRKISELERQKYEEINIYVNEGETVTLQTSAKIQKDDRILWMFGGEELQTLIAEIKENRGIFTYDDVAGERFKGKLKLDQSGSLTITNITTGNAGVYKQSFGDSFKKFIVSVRVEEKTVMVKEEESVTLETETEIQKNDQILWMFGDKDALIAQLRGETGETEETRQIITYSADERFRGRLKLDEKTGSLTITNTRTEHIGLYKLLAFSSKGTKNKKFWVSMNLKFMTVTEGESVTMKPDTEIQRDDQIQWLFGAEETPIAKTKVGTGEIVAYILHGRISGTYKLNKETGSLTITKIAKEHDELYKLKIIRQQVTTIERFRVVVGESMKSLMKGNNEKRVNESATVGRDDVAVVNEQEGSALLFKI